MLRCHPPPPLPTPSISSHGQCVLQTRLQFLLTPEEHSAADSTLLSLLGDSRREVQETACLAMSTRAAHLTAARVRALCQNFATKADGLAASRTKRRKIAKRQAAAAAAITRNGGARKESVAAAFEGGRVAGAAGKVAVQMGEDAETLQLQQTSVLGLSAVILAAPCDVPAWIPGALESLARHANDESPGRLPVRHTVSVTLHGVATGGWLVVGGFWIAESLRLCACPACLRGMVVKVSWDGGGTLADAYSCLENICFRMIPYQ